MTIQISNIKQKTNLYNKIYILSEKDFTQNLNIFPKINIYYNKNIFKFDDEDDEDDFLDEYDIILKIYIILISQIYIYKTPDSIKRNYNDYIITIINMYVDLYNKKEFNINNELCLYELYNIIKKNKDIKKLDYNYYLLLYDIIYIMLSNNNNIIDLKEYKERINENIENKFILEY